MGDKKNPYDKGPKKVPIIGDRGHKKVPIIAVLKSSLYYRQKGATRVVISSVH